MVVAALRMVGLVLGGILIVIGALGGVATVGSLFFSRSLFIEGRFMTLAAAGAVEVAGILLVFLSLLGVRRATRSEAREVTEPHR